MSTMAPAPRPAKFWIAELAWSALPAASITDTCPAVFLGGRRRAGDVAGVVGLVGRNRDDAEQRLVRRMGRGSARHEPRRKITDAIATIPSSLPRSERELTVLSSIFPELGDSRKLHLPHAGHRCGACFSLHVETVRRGRCWPRSGMSRRLPACRPPPCRPLSTRRRSSAPNCARASRPRSPSCDYAPLSAARNLKRGRSQLIALVVSDLANPFFSRVVCAAEAAAAAWGYALVVFNSDEKPENERRILARIRTLSCDGILLVPVDAHARAEFRDEEGRTVPLVHFGRTADGGRSDSVTIDNAAAGRQVTDYLLDLGHRRIGTITGPLHLTTGRGRLDGLSEAMAARGLAPKAEHVRSGEFREDVAYSVAREMIDGPDRPTALYAASGVMALGRHAGAGRSRPTLPGRHLHRLDRHDSRHRSAAAPADPDRASRDGDGQRSAPLAERQDREHRAGGAPSRRVSALPDPRR